MVSFPCKLMPLKIPAPKCLHYWKYSSNSIQDYLTFYLSNFILYIRLFTIRYIFYFIIIWNNSSQISFKRYNHLTIYLFSWFKLFSNYRIHKKLQVKYKCNDSINKQKDQPGPVFINCIYLSNLYFVAKIPDLIYVYSSFSYSFAAE